MKPMIACLVVQVVLAGSSFAQQPPTSPAAPPSPTAPGISRPTAISGLELKAALCQIDGILSPMDGVPVPPAESALCQPFFSIDNVPTYIADGGNVLDFVALSKALVAYYEFRALAFGGAQQCAPLVNIQAAAEKSVKRKLTFKSNWELNCTDYYNDIRFVQALVMRDPNAAALCVRASSNGKRGNDVSELCRRAAAASDFRAFGKSACKGDMQCVRFFRSVSGDESACRSADEAASGIVLCPGFVAFAKAGPAKNPSLCGGNDVCLAMTGSAVRAAVDAQAAIAGNLGPVLLPVAQGKLKTLSAEVDPLNEAVAKELDLRAERVAALRLKYDPSSRKAVSGKKGAGNAQEDK